MVAPAREPAHGGGDRRTGGEMDISYQRRAGRRCVGGVGLERLSLTANDELFFIHGTGTGTVN